MPFLVACESKWMSRICSCVCFFYACMNQCSNTWPLGHPVDTVNKPLSTHETHMTDTGQWHTTILSAFQEASMLAPLWSLCDDNPVRSCQGAELEQKSVKNFNFKKFQHICLGLKDRARLLFKCVLLTEKNFFIMLIVFYCIVLLFLNMMKILHCIW